MPEILAHRGNIHGPSGTDENQLATVRLALAHGWGLELDIRQRDDGRFYISHDPASDTDERLADAFFAEIRRYPHATVALNIKEAGSERELLDLLAEAHVRQQVFLFDMELIEPHPGQMARQFHALDPAIRIAARVSDRGESIDRALAIEGASVIWLDEFDRLWCTEADVRRLKAAGRSVYAVSPDLHQFPHGLTRARWADLLHWGVDGICTDYAAELDQCLGTTPAWRHIA